MAKDRLEALKAAAQDDDDDVDDVAVTMDAGGYMEDFFQEVEGIRTKVNQINQNVELVKRAHSSILSAPQPDERVKQDLEQRMSDIKRTANQVRQKLKAMEARIEQTEQESSASADLRIRKSQHATLSRQFIEYNMMVKSLTESMKHYDEVQIAFRTHTKRLLMQQLATTGKVTNNDEIEDMLEKGTPNVFIDGIIIDTQQAKQTLKDITDRHEDIMKLETSIRELHEMFTDMATLVESQGEMIDRIEFNVDHAVNYINSAKADTKTAVKYQSAARKKYMIIGGIAIAVILIIIIIVLATR
ncbi:hypothetical protein SNEBB_001265 [Seison nebaliae]|nr:hypothetical protein SNEBB_001265 [Seison nebaliae]